jgi:hypothetical protein
LAGKLSRHFYENSSRMIARVGLQVTPIIILHIRNSSHQEGLVSCYEGWSFMLY